MMPGREPDPADALKPLTTVEVDLGALARNVRALKGLLSGTTRLMAVVKANAYGHGAVPVARTALASGADFLAVARISEAAELRKGGIDAPVLMFGVALPGHTAYMADHGIRASITDMAAAKILSQRLKTEGKILKVHIKVDTGMGRLGLVHEAISAAPSSRAVDHILAIRAMDGLEVEGVYTHLSKADETDKTHTQEQIRRFNRMIAQLAQKGFTPRICHAANSAGIIDLPESHFDMVRPGIAMYGLWPSDQVDRSRVSLAPVMGIRSRLIQVKQVPKGFDVSYGATHVTSRPTTIATVPIGYADGYSRLLSNRGEMLVRGQRAKITGRVCMDFTMIDVGHIPDAAPGDEVVIIGRQGDQEILADHIAAHMNTINYEVTAGLTGRMSCRYLNPGEQHAQI